MIYLSCLPLNPASRQVQAEMRNPYEMHRTLSRAFGDAKDAYHAARCLFRVDEVNTAPGPRLLVQSLTRPDWDYLDARYTVAVPVVKEFAPEFQEGQPLAFRLRANPTVCREGKRLGLYKDEERQNWLARKGKAQGFQVRRALIQLEDQSRFEKNGAGCVTLSAVCFDGVLTVTDPAAFRTAVESGIGRAKAFGFGLLSLARPR